PLRSDRALDRELLQRPRRAARARAPVGREREEGRADAPGPDGQAVDRRARRLREAQGGGRGCLRAPAAPLAPAGGSAGADRSARGGGQRHAAARGRRELDRLGGEGEAMTRSSRSAGAGWVAAVMLGCWGCKSESRAPAMDRYQERVHFMANAPPAAERAA